MGDELAAYAEPEPGFDKIPPETPLPPLRNTERPDETPEAALDHLKSELDYEILEMKRVLRKGGVAVWRSAAKRPWYRQRFELAGFKGESSFHHVR